MSVFGGDSWGREAQHRKRRVEHLLTDESVSSSSSSFKKLSNGKYACRICSHHPLIDSPLLFSTHVKGSRHRAAESRLKQRELNIKHEISKRVALSSDSLLTDSSGSSSNKPTCAAKPLIAQTLKATSEVLNQAPQNKLIIERSGMESSSGQSYIVSEASSCTGNTYFPVHGAAQMAVVEQHINYRERRERDLKYTAAGWKRDCHGKWFKDENVEFDSDEEDPNVCLG